MAGLLPNRTLWAPILTWFLVQVWKFISLLLFEHKVDWRMLWAPGGMPSSHSALVSALAMSVAINSGFGSTEFAISVVLAMIVMYDAAGIRQAAGKHAKMINRILDELLSGQPFTEERLREILGHTPFQVVVGCLVGLIGGFLFNR
ncbi:MAG TPA: divergent PAP2 family protein [Anaerolineae bacterium]